MHSRRARLETLRDRYLAVSLRSRSVRLFRPTRSGAVDLTAIKALTPSVYRHLVTHLGTDHAKPVPLVDVSPEGKALARVAGNIACLARAAREVEMETGARELAVGWPILEGRAGNGAWFRGPLFLYPVAIEQTQTGRLCWAVTFDGAPVFNRTLMELIERNEGVRAPASLFEAMDDDGLYRPDDATWAGFHRALEAASLWSGPIPTQLPPLKPLMPRDREEREAVPKHTFRLHHTPVLGRFPRWGSTVVRDYETLLDGELTPERLGLADQLLAIDEDHTASSPVQSGPSVDVATLARWSVLPSDESQDRVLRFASAHSNAGLVVEGPPGTGKSQLITNLVAQEIARGRRVLVVCQKRAALDVVAQRIAHLGIGSALALVHDVERDRSRVLKEIAHAIKPLQALADTSTETWDAEASTYLQFCQRLEQSQQAHRTLTEAPQGRPPLVALQERALGRHSEELPEVSDAGSILEADAHPAVLAASLLASRAPAPHDGLEARKRWHMAPPGSQDQLLDALRELKARTCRLAALQPHLTPAECRSHLALWEATSALLDLVDAGGPPENTLRYFWMWSEGDLVHGEWRRVMTRLRDAAKELAPCLPELVTRPREEVEELLAHLQTYEELAPTVSRFFLPRWWRARAASTTLGDACNAAGWSLDSTASATALVESALAWMTLIDDLPLDMPFMEVGLAGDPADIQRTIEGLQRHHDFVSAVHRLRETLRPLAEPFSHWPEMGRIETPLRSSRLLGTALDARETARLLAACEPHLTTAGAWMSASWVSTLQRQLEAGRFHAAQESIQSILDVSDRLAEAMSFDRLARDLPDWAWSFVTAWGPASPETATRHLWTALEAGWREAILQGRDPAAVEAPLVSSRLLDQLGQCLDEVQQGAGAAVRDAHDAHVRKRASKELSKLSMDARKKRYRLTLRQVVTRYWDCGLAALKPAWFCSPDAAAALFPLKPGLFDLVIFDEASQCPVESALPALVRGRSAVIAGDDKQMPPSHFFRSSFGDEDDVEEALLATESVLALAREVFPNTMLRWHYRSAHEVLIAFSNAAFYRRELATAPQPKGADGKALSFTRVKGLWQDQTNLIEAEAVARRVVDVLDQEVPPSAGVIAFNRKQATAIEAALDTLASTEERALRILRRERARPVVERLFVRNLENVQGDERDVILLSVGYGPRTPGERTHARFGPVSQEGGEKRLNVAVTRARARMQVFCSFDPNTLNVSSARHLGPRLLKLYLRFACFVDQREAILTEVADLGEGRSLGDPASSDRHLWGQRVLREVHAALSAHDNLSVKVGVGLGSETLDLVVRSGTGAPVGIDCRRFWAVPDALARDVYGLRFWKRLGWRVMRLTPQQWESDGIEGLLLRLQAMGCDTGALAEPEVRASVVP